MLVGLITRRSFQFTSIYTDPRDSGRARPGLVTSVWEPWVGATGVCTSGACSGPRCGVSILAKANGWLRGG